MIRIRPTYIAVGAAVGLAASAGIADPSRGEQLTHVPNANAKAAGSAPASRHSPELRSAQVAQGSLALENPEGIIGWYGYENSAPSADDATKPQMVPGTPATPREAQKTEPDKNTYLVLRAQTGGDRNYDYGTHFLFQGHEGGARDAQGRVQGYITRINLDADESHRVTLMATHDTLGRPLDAIDGSTWDPFAQRLLFTTEDQNGPTLDVTLDYSRGAQPIRWLAEGRDASATLDSANGGFGTNEGDNEITGVHVSDGDASVHGILGAKVPHVFRDGWRWFWTQQHGDNYTWEVLPADAAPR